MGGVGGGLVKAYKIGHSGSFHCRAGGGKSCLHRPHPDDRNSLLGFMGGGESPRIKAKRHVGCGKWGCGVKCGEGSGKDGRGRASKGPSPFGRGV